MRCEVRLKVGAEQKRAPRLIENVQELRRKTLSEGEGEGTTSTKNYNEFYANLVQF